MSKFDEHMDEQHDIVQEKEQLASSRKSELLMPSLMGGALAGLNSGLAEERITNVSSTGSMDAVEEQWGEEKKTQKEKKNKKNKKKTRNMKWKGRNSEI